MPLPAPEPGPQLGTLLAGGYALLLLLIALGIERTARRTRRRAESYHTGGFVYLPDRDAWRCPRGQTLWPAEVDRVRGLTRYRARAEACNRCPLKSACTESSDGREITGADAGWLDSEVDRFHRAVSFLLVVLAGLVAALALLRDHDRADALLLAPILLVVAATASRRLRGLRRRGRPG
jgi:hypothetical protein